MKKGLILVILLFQVGLAQGVNNSALLNFKDNVSVTVTGNYTHNDVAQINLEAGTVLNIEGSITDNGGSVSGDGEIYLNGVDVYGCTDPFAINYNPEAYWNDGSCEFAEDNIMWLNSNFLGGSTYELDAFQYNYENDIWTDYTNQNWGTEGNPMRAAYNPNTNQIFVVLAISGQGGGYQLDVYDISSNTWDTQEFYSFPDYSDVFDIVYDIENDLLVLSSYKYSTGVSIHTYNYNTDAWNTFTSSCSIGYVNENINLLYNSKTKKVVIGKKYDGVLSLHEIDIANGGCENIYTENDNISNLHSNDNFIYDTKRNRYLYVRRNGDTVNIAAIENENEELHLNYIASQVIGSQNLVSPSSQNVPSAYLHKDDKLAFSWVSPNNDNSDDYYNTLYTYDFNEDSWSLSEPMYISTNNYARSDMAYYPENYTPPYSGPTWHVSTTGSDSNDGSEGSPFATIQHGIDEAASGDTVLVAAGTYVENINYNGKNIVVGSLYLTTSDTSYISSTIIDGNQNGSVVEITNGEDSTAVLSGFTIQNGSTDNGGGLYIDNSDPQLLYLIIKANNANYRGGGIYFRYSSAKIFNTVIANNSASYDGGGLYAQQSDDIEFVQSLIIKNTCSEQGSGLCVYTSEISLLNTTIWGNSGSTQGVIFNGTGSNFYLKNSIIWESAETLLNDGYLNIQYSDIYAGEGMISNMNGSVDYDGSNINEDPQFISEVLDSPDLHLESTSPCIDAGDPNLDDDGEDYTTDEDDQDPDGTRMDMGAYYFHQTLGCTDPTAINYDPEATSNDGSCYHDVVTDIDGNEYQAVQIGDQLWMKENLNVTHYNNGDEIPTGLDNDTWTNATEGAYAIYDDDPANADIYGNLYNWYAVDDSRNIAPEGWHVPSDYEIKELEMYLGMSQEEADEEGNSRGTNEGSKLAGMDDLWIDGALQDDGDFEASGFNLLPAGFRTIYGDYSNIGDSGYLWSTTENNSDHAFYRFLHYNSSKVNRVHDSIVAGFSVRCVKSPYSGPTWHVSTSGSDDNDGSEEIPFATIQAGIDAASNGDTVLVSAGTYVENINYNGKNIAVIGDGRETTIIDGNQNGSVVRFENGEGSAAVLSGFTITNGYAGYGGGIFCESSSPRLFELVVTDNNAQNAGGGIFCHLNSNTQISETIISNNSATFGGGFSCEVYSNPQLFNVKIINNNATEGGGVESAHYAHPYYSNVQISGNSASYGGAIRLVTHGLSTFSHITISNNSASNYGVAQNHNNSFATITNAIIWNNFSGNGQDMQEINYLDITYSDVEGGWSGEGNIDADPLFVDPNNSDFTLQATSPCIDAGDPDLDGDGEDYITDVDDQDPDGTRMDMGAYYFHQTSGCTDPTAINYNPEAITNDGSCYHDVVTDIDGNEYQAVQIGDQLWMKENLKVAHYNNGDEIPTDYSNNDWTNLSTGAYAVYDDNESNADIYGNLYNWYAVDDNRSIAPEGWHVPTDDEYMELEMYLGMSEEDAYDSGWRGTNQGCQLAGNAELWNDGGFQNNEAFGTSGYTALPAGYRSGDNGNSLNIGIGCHLWSSTQDGINAWKREINYSVCDVNRHSNSKKWGLSIRCLANEIETSTILVPQDYPTIQAGIDASSDGDTVLVSAGTYVENINFNGKNIVVGSLMLTTQDTSYISSTIIDGNQSGSVVTFENGEDSTAVLSGFTITNGYAGYGGGIIASDASSPLLNNLIIQGNHANIYGGGVYLYTNSDAIIRNTVISGNNCNDDGGGIHCNNSDPSMENVTITNNSALYGGGGIQFTNTSNPSMENVTIIGNTAEIGGGIYIYQSNPNLNNVTITNNTTSNSGGGIYCGDNSGPTFTNCIIKDNTTALQGGGIAILWGSANLKGCSIINNTVIGTSGGDGGGGIFVFNSNVQIDSSIVAHNSESQNDGGGLLVRSSGGSSSITIVNSVFYSNTSVDEGGAINIDGGNSSGSIVNTICWNNSAGSNWNEINVGNSGENVDVSYCDIEGGYYWGGEEIIDADPLFCNAVSSDFTLYDNSPCVGTGEGGANMGAYGVGCYSNLDDLILNNQNINLSGTNYYDNVKLSNGAIINVNSSLNLIISDTLFIDSSSQIRSNGVSTNTEGTGEDIAEGSSQCCWGGGSGGSYGGIGGMGNNPWGYNSGPVYGDSINVQSGSRGSSGYDYYGNIEYGKGGGKIELSAKHSLINGIISANGSNGDDAEGDNGDGGGSGGGISLVSENLIINGYLEVKGGNGGASLGGGGAGGKIYIQTNSVADFPANFLLNGGIGYNDGNIGTYFLETFPYSGPTWYVATTGSDSNDGSEENPFATIQHGIDMSSDGDTVLVQPGTYVENINFNGKNIVVGSLMLTTQDTSYIAQTVIDGNQNGSVVTFESGEDSTAILDGFILKNGFGNELEGYGWNLGGGVFCWSSTATIKNLLIENNSGSHGSGIALMNYSFLSVNNVIIDDNSSTGVFCYNGSEIELTNCIIKNNEGSGINCSSSYPSFPQSNLIISNSEILNNGGNAGIDLVHTPANISNVLIANNNGNRGGLTCSGDDDNAYDVNVMVTNSSIANNSSSDNLGDGITCWFNASLYLINSIISQDDGISIYLGVENNSDFPGTAYISYSDIIGGESQIVLNSNSTVEWLDGNIDSDPLFVDPDNGDFYLTASSPCIDTGDPDLDGDGEDYTTDTDDQDPDGTRMDMGAFYYHHSDTLPPTVTLTSLNGGETLVTDSSYAITWLSDDDVAVKWAKLYYSTDNALTFQYIDSVSAVLETYEWAVPPEAVTDEGRVKIVVSDYEDNIAADTSDAVFTILDGTPPEVSILNPTYETSIPEYDELSVSWSVSDNVAPDTVIIHFSSDGGQSFLQVGSESADSGSYSITVPAGVTDSAQVKLIVTDTNGNEGSAFSDFFSVTDNTPPTVSVETPGEVAIDDTLLITWSAEDNTELRSHHLYYSTDDGETFIFIDSVEVGAGKTAGSGNDGHLKKDFIERGRALGKQPQYSLDKSNADIRQLYRPDPSKRNSATDFSYPWVTPNVVTSTARISITTYDVVNLSASDTTDAFEIVDNIPPEVTVISPTSGFTIPEYNDLTVTWNASDNIEMDSVRVYFSNYSGEGFTLMGAVLSDVAEFTFEVPVGVTDEAQIRLVAVDIFGNEGAGYSDFFSVTDNTPPTVSVETPGEVAIDDTLLITWSAEDNTELRSHHLYYSTDDGETFTFIDSVEVGAGKTAGSGRNGRLRENLTERGNNLRKQPQYSLDKSDADIRRLYRSDSSNRNSATDFSYPWVVPNVVTSIARISITTYDVVNLSASDTTDAFEIVDNIPPEVTVTSPTPGFTIPEHNDLTVTWSASDNIGMDSVRVYFSNEGGEGFTLMGAVLSDVAEFTFEVPVGVTDEAQIRLVAVDIFGNEGAGYSDFFSVTDNTPPTVAVTTPESSSIADTVSIEWSASDNTTLRSHHLYFSSDDGLNFTLVDSAAGADSSYDWTVPNVVTSIARISITTYDVVNLSASDTTDAFEIVDNIPPEISLLTPSEGFSIPEYEEVEVTWSASDNIELDSIRVYYSIDGGTTFEQMGQVSSENTSFAFSIPPGVTFEAQVSLTAVDIFGNSGEDVSGFFTVTDNTPPSVTIDTPAELFIEEMAQLSWTAEDNTLLGSHHISYSADGGQSYTFIDSVAGSESTFDWTVPNVMAQEVLLAIATFDTVGLSAHDTSDFFAILDGIAPEITSTAPIAGYSIPEYHTLTTTWAASDNIGLDSIHVYFSSNGGDTLQYEGAVTADSTSFTFEIPQGLTETAVVKVVAVDVSGNEAEDTSDYFTVTDFTPPTIQLLTPLSGESYDIDGTMEITWSASDNVGVESIDILYSSDNGQTWQEIATGEQDDGVNTWIVPNDPSDSVRLQVVAYDAVPLSDTSEVADLSIDIVYPEVVSVSPGAGGITWYDTQIAVVFSQQMEPAGLSEENVVISSGFSDSVTSDYSYVDSSKTLFINLSSGFSSLDTIAITLMADGVANYYGYLLDGDGDGVPGDDYTINFTTAMLADYDTSGTIDGADLANFVQGWQEKDYFYELGPVIGDTPHLISLPDQAYNIEDMMAFILMGNWYLTNGQSFFRELSDFGLPLQITATQDTVTVELPEGTLAFDLQIRHDPHRIELFEPPGEATIRLQRYDEGGDIYELVSTVEGESHLRIPMSLRGKRGQIEVSFRAFGSNGEILVQSTRRLTIENIPEQFALHQNYPNPFNPTTIIEYDLPQDSHVKLVIYDILGREVVTLVDELQNAGYRSVEWRGDDKSGVSLSSGTYIYRISAKHFSGTKKMVLIK